MNLYHLKPFLLNYYSGGFLLYNLNKKFHKNKQKNRNNKFFSLIEDYNYLDRIFQKKKENL